MSQVALGGEAGCRAGDLASDALTRVSDHSVHDRGGAGSRPPRWGPLRV